MPEARSNVVTQLLHRVRGGDASARERLFEVVQQELRRLAAAQLRRQAGAVSWQPTELVNEAYLRLLEPSDLDVADRSHFFAVAGTVMRRVLVDHYRRRHAAKRGGAAGRVTWIEPADTPLAHVDVLALDEALQRLAELEPRKAKVVELRFFGGLSMDEVAGVLEVSKRTVEADWFFARAWLHATLGGGEA